MQAKVRLEATSGPLAGTVVPFDEPDMFVAGRGKDCHVRLPHDDNEASRHHFVMAIQPPRVSIRDLGSLNGTFVNGRKIGGRDPTETPEQGAAHEHESVGLRDGDQISAGATSFRLSVEQPIYCPSCGRPIEGVTLDEYVSWSDPRCPRCRERSAVKPPPGPAPVTSNGGSQDPLAELIRSLAERRGLQPQPTGGAPQIPGYEIGDELGRGAMGVVYRGRRLADGAAVAVKVMLAEREVDERAWIFFKREVELQRRLVGHPHCVALLDAEMEGLSSYFVMEFCPGGSIDKLMERRGGRLPLGEAGPLVLDALDGLAHAHSLNIVHRDLKPQNVLLTDREGGAAKLTDFGLSKDFERAGLTDPTKTGDIGGNPMGMPREQVIDYKHVKPISDVWGMGATFYNMLTGTTPRDFGRGRHPINVILTEPPVPIRHRNPAIPLPVAEVIDHALRDDLAQRYPTALAFREALVAVL